MRAGDQRNGRRAIRGAAQLLHPLTGKLERSRSDPLLTPPAPVADYQLVCDCTGSVPAQNALGSLCYLTYLKFARIDTVRISIGGSPRLLRSGVLTLLLMETSSRAKDSDGRTISTATRTISPAAAWVYGSSTIVIPSQIGATIALEEAQGVSLRSGGSMQRPVHARWHPLTPLVTSVKSASA